MTTLEPRFGNKRKASKAKAIEGASSAENLLAMETQNDSDLVAEEEDVERSVSENDGLIAFMKESQKKQKVVPTRQIIFRLPIDKFEKIEKLKGNVSFQKFYADMTDYFLAKSK